MELSNLVNKVVEDIDAQKVRELWESYLARIGRPETSDEEDALMEGFAHQVLKVANQTLDSNFFNQYMTRLIAPIYSIGDNWGKPRYYVPGNFATSMTINKVITC